MGWDDIERPKPDPQPVVRGCELLGFDPSECLYVGDAPFDLQSGNAAGASTAAVTWGMFNEPALTAERPLVRFAHLGRADRKHAGVALAFGICGASDTSGGHIGDVVLSVQSGSAALALAVIVRKCGCGVVCGFGAVYLPRD